MCDDATPVEALQYLQTEVAAVVDHGDADEAEAFRGLLAHLLAPEDEGKGERRAGDEDEEMRDGEGGGKEKERARQRMEVFESLLGLVNASAKEPAENLIDLVDRDEDVW